VFILGFALGAYIRQKFLECLLVKILFTAAIYLPGSLDRETVWLPERIMPSNNGELTLEAYYAMFIDIWLRRSSAFCAERRLRRK
jgi:hypothetical protein